jgi:hypothetical protein
MNVIRARKHWSYAKYWKKERRKINKEETKARQHVWETASMSLLIFKLCRLSWNQIHSIQRKDIQFWEQFSWSGNSPPRRFICTSLFKKKKDVETSKHTSVIQYRKISISITYCCTVCLYS